MMKYNSNDSIINNYEFKRYCKKYYKRIGKWLSDTLLIKNNEVLNNREYIDVVWVKDNHVDGHYEFRATDKLNDIALKLAGLKKYFHCFTLLEEKEPVEVKQWQEYLIYASIFGLASNISDKFDKLNIGDLYFGGINIVDNFIKDTIVPTFKDTDIINKK